MRSRVDEHVVDQADVADVAAMATSVSPAMRATGSSVSAETAAKYSGSIPASARIASPGASATAASCSPSATDASTARSARDERRRATARVGIETHVAARHREAVRLAHGRTDLDVHRDVEVAHEAADDQRLLRVLLAEEGVVRLHHVQQLRHDGGDAAEMARGRASSPSSGSESRATSTVVAKPGG